MDIITEFKGAKIRKTIHLIRHGQTDFNKQGIIQGSGIDSDLNETGRWQASRFYEFYKEQNYHHIYTSKLKRAIQSVEGFIDKGIGHTPLEEFNEINWGIMEGRRSSPETALMYDKIIRQWSNGDVNSAIDEGETPLEMYERQAKGMQLLMSKTNEEHVLICMHGRALRSFLCLLTGVPLKEMERWQHDNLCLYELEYNGRHFDIIKANDRTHLL